MEEVRIERPAPNSLVCGDTLDAMGQMASESVHLIFADPPYWMRTEGNLSRVEGTVFDGVREEWDEFASQKDYEEFTRTWLTECKRVLSKNGSISVIGSMQCIYTIGGIMQDLGFWFINDIVWHKTNPTPNFKGTRLNNAHETMIWATKSRDAKYTFNYKVAKELNKDTVSLHEHESGVRKQMGSVWRFPVCNGGERLRDAQGKKLHPTQKPEGILYRIINICSNLGDTVFDPFGGTMTTAKVAKQCGRGYISIERDAMYYEHGLARVDATEPVITNIERATFDKKPPRAIFADLIEREYLHKGERLFMRRKSDKSVVLQADGRIKLECGNLMDIHKGAAVFLGGRREKVNGYDYWAVLRDGKLTSIDEIRKKYRERELGYVYEEVA